MAKAQPKKESEAPKKAPAKKLVWTNTVYHRSTGKIIAGTEVTAEQKKLFSKEFIDLYAK